MFRQFASCNYEQLYQERERSNRELEKKLNEYELEIEDARESELEHTLALLQLELFDRTVKAVEYLLSIDEEPRNRYQQLFDLRTPMRDACKNRQIGGLLEQAPEYTQIVSRLIEKERERKYGTPHPSFEQQLNDLQQELYSQAKEALQVVLEEEKGKRVNDVDWFRRLAARYATAHSEEDEETLQLLAEHLEDIVPPFSLQEYCIELAEYIKLRTGSHFKIV